MLRTRSPFPGMDPWIEDPAIWLDFHDGLVTYLRDELQGSLPDVYYARIQDRVYVEQTERWVVPDIRVSRREDTVRPRASTAPAAAPAPREGGAAPTAVIVEEPSFEVREPFIEIRDRRTGNSVVTVIEILSPGNKRPGSDGAELYRVKQAEVLKSAASLVEIDLLRGGEHVVAVTPERLEPHRPFDYLVVVRRASRPNRREVHPIPLRSPLPRVAVPLRDPDPDVEVDLGALVSQAYERGAYGKTVDYEAPPREPLLSAEDAAWAKERIARDATRPG